MSGTEDISLFKALCLTIKRRIIIIILYSAGMEWEKPGIKVTRSNLNQSSNK